jgi:hypothetical protein
VLGLHHGLPIALRQIHGASRGDKGRGASRSVIARVPFNRLGADYSGQFMTLCLSASIRNIRLVANIIRLHFDVSMVDAVTRFELTPN